MYVPPSIGHVGDVWDTCEKHGRNNYVKNKLYSEDNLFLSKVHVLDMWGTYKIILINL